MNLEPIAITDLDHRAYYLRYSQNSSFYMVAFPEGYVTMLDKTFKTVNHTRFKAEIKDVYGYFRVLPMREQDDCCI